MKSNAKFATALDRLLHRYLACASSMLPLVSKAASQPVQFFQQNPVPWMQSHTQTGRGCLHQGTAQFPLRQKLSYVIKKITSFLDFKFAELIESLGWVHKWWSVPSDNTSTVQGKQWHMDSVQVTYKTQKPVITKATVHLSILLR